MNQKVLSISCYQDDIQKKPHEVSRDSASVAKVPESQWISEGSKLERLKYSFITNEESFSAANSNGRKFLYKSKGLNASSLLVKL